MDADAKAAADAFGLIGNRDAVSLCPYGPVYRVSDGRGAFVLKRTGYPHSGALAIASWLRMLEDHKVDIVAPVTGFAPNPRQVIVGSEPGFWVLYPFIEGEPFSGSMEQLRGAGALLAKIHTLGEDYKGTLRQVKSLPVHDMNWTTTQIELATLAVAKYAPDVSDIFIENVKDRLTELSDEKLLITNSRLVLSACSWDYKASNIIIAGGNKPVLVDPDHAGCIPRIYDLACSVLLFNCDHDHSKPRLFRKGEWRSFRDGYNPIRSLTVGEFSVWPQMLKLAWLDQGIWLLGNWPEGWESEKDALYLRDLATNSLQNYGLGKLSPKRTAKSVDRFFNDDGTINVHPSKSDDRRAILEVIAQDFSVDMVYSEEEVNCLLKRRTSLNDWAYLRRALVDGGWLVRNIDGRCYTKAEEKGRVE